MSRRDDKESVSITEVVRKQRESTSQKALAAEKICGWL
jgi:hypothetical protein